MTRLFGKIFISDSESIDASLFFVAVITATVPFPERADTDGGMTKAYEILPVSLSIIFNRIFELGKKVLWLIFKLVRIFGS